MALRLGALRSAALEFGGAGALVKALIPTLIGLTARGGENFAAANGEIRRRDTAERAAVPSSATIILLSPEAEAALAPLDLPPDGPIDPSAVLRARLAPDVAARNFVSWARALDLVGPYAKRSIYSLYCEFSEVDGRPPLSDTRFLEALAQTEGITKEQHRIGRGNGKVRRSWQWTIEPPQKARALAAIAADTRQPEPAPAPGPVDAAPVPATPELPAILLASAKPARSTIVLPRFASDADHPFSPTGLREGEKSARRMRLNAAASRKQRGALRRAA